MRATLPSKTKRTQGVSLEAIIADINPALIGWFGYFKHAHKNTFVWMDGWVRMRLRSILRKRKGRKGRGKLLVCSIDILSQTHNPEQNLVNRQLLQSLTQYLLSPQFDPEETIQATQLESILD